MQYLKIELMKHKKDLVKVTEHIKPILKIEG